MSVVRARRWGSFLVLLAVLALLPIVRSGAVTARTQGAADEFNDSHFHLTNYVQQGISVQDFLKIMGRDPASADQRRAEMVPVTGSVAGRSTGGALAEARRQRAAKRVDRSASRPWRDQRDLSRRIVRRLRASHERPRCRAAESHDEGTPPHGDPSRMTR